MLDTAAPKTATIYRMATGEKTCPHGLKAKDLLMRKGYTVDDQRLTNRDEIDALKARLGVQSTPQVFIGDQRIGGFDDLSAHFGVPAKAKDGVTYTPVIMLFSVAALMAAAVAWMTVGDLATARTVELFISIAMVLLGLQKLQDIERFATMFLNYDLLAQRWIRYGYVYPFAETGAGLLMMMGALTWLSAPVALFIAGIGAVSVFKAVYIEKRDLKCACVGGDSRVPLGFVSLLENVMMVGMAIWMLAWI